MHLRYADLKQVVLDKLLAEHCNAKLDTELHEAACMGTLQEGREVKSQNSTVSISEKNLLSFKHSLCIFINFLTELSFL